MAKEPENILEEGAKLPMPTFFKKDIEEIAKAACPRGIDLNKLGEYDFVNCDATVDNIDDAIEKGVIPSNGTYEELTDEQINGLTKILKKAVKDGAIFFSGNDMILFINFMSIDENSFNICYGCASYVSEQAHINYGVHLEINLDYSNKSLEVLLVEV